MGEIYITSDYKVLYNIKEYNISIDNHRSHTASESEYHIWMSTQFEIRMDEQDRFIKTTEREICQYKES